MRDHGAEQLVLDFSSDDVESKLDSIIRESRNILKESVPEGGSTFRKQKQNDVFVRRNGNVFTFGDEFNFART